MGDGSDGSAAQAGRAGRLTRRLAVALAAAAALFAAPARARAQFAVRASEPWRTVQTRRFAFHYPADLEDWTLALVRHVEAVDSLVTQVVGATPSRRTQVVVDDPYAQANGSAWPFLRQPVISLWASPPNPREDIGQFEDWGEMVIAHEFAHIAHLTRPSRNPLERAIWSVAPVELGPIPVQAPRWVIEGYATYVEGKVTGSGRPHGTWLPAILRQWALEGQLPTYGELSAWNSYEGGAFAYLAGSAFLQWLTERPGQNDQSLVKLWRRLTARTPRAFDEAFAGVFGDAPAVLYGYFRADLTERALEARALEAAAGLDTGVIEQRFAWGTGDPAISPDGQRVAVTVRSATKPGRLIVFKAAAPPDTARARRDSALLARDPEDVPARPLYPAPRRVLASLDAVGPYAYQSPRWLRNGRILTWRSTARGDGTLRPALYLWRPGRRGVERVPNSIGLSEPDPFPDGTSAVATRCLGGKCDVVRIDLATGDLVVLALGDVTRSFYRPRVSPDGRSVVASASLHGRWRLVRIDGGSLTAIDPDDGANRYDAAFLNADTLVCVADVGGVANLERLALAGGDAGVALTRVTGAAVAPEPNPADGSIWFLSLYSRGYDLRSLPRGTTARGGVVMLPDSLSPAAPVAPERRPPLAANMVSAPRVYGLGPRSTRWLPIPEYTADGASAVLEIANGDPVGRTTIEVRGAAGQPGTWRGGVAALTWNGFRPSIRAQVFSATQTPNAPDEFGTSMTAGTLDARLSGGLLALDQTEQLETVQVHARVTGVAARLTHLDAAASRDFGGRANSLLQAGGTLDIATQQHWGPAHLSASARGEATVIRDGADEFTRRSVSAAAAFYGVLPLPLLGSMTRVHANASDPFEQASYGGGESPLLDEALLRQRIAMPVLPTGVRPNADVEAYRAAVLLGGLQPYVWTARGAGCVSTGAPCQSWNRVVGAEWSSSVPAIPYAGTPPVRALLGVGRSLDAPFRHQVRGYVSVVVNP